MKPEAGHDADDREDEHTPWLHSHPERNPCWKGETPAPPHVAKPYGTTGYTTTPGVALPGVLC